MKNPEFETIQAMGIDNDGRIPGYSKLPYFWDTYHLPRKSIFGIRGEFEIKRSYSEYRTYLPKWDGQNLDEALRCLIEERGKICMLDVGCGSGNALDLPAQFKNKVDRYGITATDYRNVLQRLKDQRNGKKIITGNAEFLTDYFPQQVFDVIVSGWALNYMDQTKVLPEIVKVLSPGGIALLQGGSFAVASRLKGIATPKDGDQLFVSGVSFKREINL